MPKISKIQAPNVANAKGMPIAIIKTTTVIPTIGFLIALENN